MNLRSVRPSPPSPPFWRSPPRPPARMACRRSALPSRLPLLSQCRTDDGSRTQAQRFRRRDPVQVEGAPRVGQPVSVVLQFDGVSDPAGATVRLTTDAGLSLSTSSSLTLPAGQSTTVTAKVTVGREGLAYLNVFVMQGGATSIVAIPIQAGVSTPAMKAAGEVNSSAEARRSFRCRPKSRNRPKTPQKRPPRPESAGNPALASSPRRGL
ncbi:hypothetical protein DdX_21389 [Ditylenchus destructor]|uniref:Uncharacterized protein n=1 Tax=Ditylenchus destructor TaxID=166010 RepID=A0AAD4MJ61_9BILA|nr:hypothetical protein DdX_21389 [Ditylenchus destructor]